MPALSGLVLGLVARRSSMDCVRHGPCALRARRVRRGRARLPRQARAQGRSDRALDKVDRAVAVPKAAAPSVALGASLSTPAPAQPGRIAARSGAKHIVLDSGSRHPLRCRRRADRRLLRRGRPRRRRDPQRPRGPARAGLPTHPPRGARGPGLGARGRGAIERWRVVRLSDDRATELPVARDRIRDLKDKLGIGDPRG